MAESNDKVKESITFEFFKDIGIETVKVCNDAIKQGGNVKAEEIGFAQLCFRWIVRDLIFLRERRQLLSFPRLSKHSKE